MSRRSRIAVGVGLLLLGVLALVPGVQLESSELRQTYGSDKGLAHLSGRTGRDTTAALNTTF